MKTSLSLPNLLKIAALVLGLQLLATPASAVMVRETGLSNGMATNSLQLPILSTPQNYWAGLQVIQVDSSSFLAYCIDPFQWSPSANVSYAVRTDFNTFFSSRAADVNALYSRYYINTTSGANADLYAAGFQLALWEIVADDEVLNTGVVRTTTNTNANVVSMAQTMLASLHTPIVGGDQFAYTIYTSTSNQDYLVTRQVSEPGTLAIMLSGLGLLGAGLRRRRTQA